jgi:hypothetical protein
MTSRVEKYKGQLNGNTIIGNAAINGSSVLLSAARHKMKFNTETFLRHRIRRSLFIKNMPFDMARDHKFGA